MSKKQIYTMTEKRTCTGVMKDHPSPVLKTNGNLRLLRKDVDSWLARLTEQKAA
jgi:predicted DNA-binding transcriptional regulator AlpA